MFRFNLILLVSLALPMVVVGQGLQVSALSHNPNVATNNRQINTNLRAATPTDTISLGADGLIEDFSYESSIPNPDIWLDDQVYINRGYGIAPISIGVATFDGLDGSGYPYDFSVSNTSSNSADTLTSKPIDLNLLQGDSVYLSFYYQPQGRGNAPEAGDSLVLEFLSPEDTTSTWQKVWYKEGFTPEDSTWRLVMLPITDTLMLTKGFQFRFRNKATINGNLDHWHLDYIYLDSARTAADSVFDDVSWVYDGSSLLKNYTEMPWSQYIQAELTDEIVNTIRNHFTSVKILNYTYNIINNNTALVLDTYNGSSNINPFVQNMVYTDCQVAAGCISNAAVDATKFPASFTDSTNISIQHYFNSGAFGDFETQNDTLIVNHIFHNYFAYDDGTAELALGLNIYDAQMATSFTLNVADTLTGMDIYFNPITTNAADYKFTLHVWDDNGGKPGTIVFENTTTEIPAYDSTRQNVFTRYFLNQEVILAPGIYYMGFTQKTEEYLNVGLDVNNEAQDKLFYNVGDGWNTSTKKGAAMMRPVLRDEVVPNGIESLSEINNSLKVFPNPANNKLWLTIDSPAAALDYQIIDISGRIVLEGVTDESSAIDVTVLSEGVYFIKVQVDTTTAATKFIKQN